RGHRPYLVPFIRTTPIMILKSLPLLAAGILFTAPHDELRDMAIGDPLPASDVVMTDVSSKEMTLKELVRPNGLLVIFSCNTCPFVIGTEDSEGWEGRYPNYGELCRKNRVGMALVNSNEAKRDKGDGLPDMQRRYKEMGYDHYYLLDKDHVVADAFGARTTPHVFLFDKDLKLVYKGAIDDNVERAGEVKEHWLRNAIDAMVQGRPIDPDATRNIGCSIKRVAHTH
ncbi:MAG: hypothetical protein KDC02_18900, partial [Flavobacteriales bacterium]|nr:hypothetical protein [Flavobacteriales bacterium]